MQQKFNNWNVFNHRSMGYNSFISPVKIEKGKEEQAMASYQGDGKYIGAWHYVGLEILYAIPVIGWIFLIVHCFLPENPNRMHFARHFFVRFLLGIVIMLILMLVLYLTVGRQLLEHQDEIGDVLKAHEKEVNDALNKLTDDLGKIKFD